MRPGVEQVVKRFLEALSRRVSVDEVYVFGSSVRGDWLKDSDVDLVVVSRDFQGMPFLRRLDLVEEVQWVEGVRPHLEVIPLTPDELRGRLESSVVIRDASKYWVRLDLEGLLRGEG